MTDEPRKLTDIEVTRIYEVNCLHCGVIDAPHEYAQALEARRRHFAEHQELRPGLTR